MLTYFIQEGAQDAADLEPVVEEKTLSDGGGCAVER